MSSLPPKEMLEVEFLTATQSIIARVVTGGKRLSDILNYRGDDFIDLNGVRMERLDSAGESMVIGEFARMDKNSALVVLPQEQPLPPERPKKPLLEYVPKERYSVVVSLPPFLISGDLHIAKGADFRQVRIESMHSFLPLSDPVVLYLPDPQRRWSNPIAIINRSKLEILLLGQKLTL